VCELLAFTYHHLYKLNVSALRFFTFYGPRGRPDMAPFKFIDRVSRGVEIQQFGDGSSSRDYTYISDIVNGIVRAIDRPHKYQIFNLGKGDGTSLKEFIDLVQMHTGKEAVIKVMPDQPGDVPYTCADVTKAKHMLGYKAEFPSQRALAVLQNGTKTLTPTKSLRFAQRHKPMDLDDHHRLFSCRYTAATSSLSQKSNLPFFIFYTVVPSYRPTVANSVTSSLTSVCHSKHS
jgi:UDP-glucuronate 4-epimerase